MTNGEQSARVKAYVFNEQYGVKIMAEETKWGKEKSSKAQQNEIYCCQHEAINIFKQGRNVITWFLGK